MIFFFDFKMIKKRERKTRNGRIAREVAVTLGVFAERGLHGARLPIGVRAFGVRLGGIFVDHKLTQSSSRTHALKAKNIMAEEKESINRNLDNTPWVDDEEDWQR